MEQNWEQMFEKKFACSLDSCCDGKNMADHFTVEHIKSFIHENFLPKSQIEAVLEEMKELCNCNKGRRTHVSEHGCPDSGANGFNRALNTLKGRLLTTPAERGL